MFILKALSYDIPKPLYRYKPDDLLPLLYKDICYQGDILEYKEDSGYDYEYFSPWTFHLFWDLSLIHIYKGGIISRLDLPGDEEFDLDIDLQMTRKASKKTKELFEDVYKRQLIYSFTISWLPVPCLKVIFSSS